MYGRSAWFGQIELVFGGDHSSKVSIAHHLKRIIHVAERGSPLGVFLIALDFILLVLFEPFIFFSLHL